MQKREVNIKSSCISHSTWKTGKTSDDLKKKKSTKLTEISYFVLQTNERMGLTNMAA